MYLFKEYLCALEFCITFGNSGGYDGLMVKWFSQAVTPLFRREDLVMIVMSEPDADILRRRPSNTFIFDRLDDKKALMSGGLLFGLLGMAVKFFIAQHLPCFYAVRSSLIYLIF